MQLTFTTILVILAAFSVFIVLISQILQRQQSPHSQKLFAAFLMAILASQFNFILMSSNFVLSVPNLAFIGNTVGLLAAPLLYFYAKSLVSNALPITNKDWPHAIAFVMIFSMVIFGYHMKPESTKLLILTDPEYISPLMSYSLPLFIFTTVFCYLFATILMVRQFRLSLLERYSKIEDIDLSWLSISIYSLLMLWVLDVVRFLVIGLWPKSLLHSILFVFLAVGTFIVAVYFLLHALRQNQIQNSELETLVETEKYGQHRLEDHELHVLKKHVEAIFNAVHPEKKADLTLNALAEQLPMTARELSQVINRSFGKSFFDFINQKRVEYAMEHLHVKDEETIADIMFDAGFASKSAFYKAFKKHTGTTPQKFRSLTPDR